MVAPAANPSPSERARARGLGLGQPSELEPDPFVKIEILSLQAIQTVLAVPSPDSTQASQRGDVQQHGQVGRQPFGGPARQAADVLAV